MNAIILAALLYRATFIPVPPSLNVLYIQAGFDPQYCRVTDWDWYAKPLEAECSQGKKWAHFDLDPTYFDPVF